MNVKPLYWIGGGLLVTGIAVYAREQYIWSQKIDMDFGNYKILRLGLQHTVVGVDMLLVNNGELSVEISGVRANVKANGIFVGVVDTAHSVMLHPNAQVEVPMRVSFNPTHVFKSIFKIASLSESLDAMNFEFKGKITVKKFGLPIPIPLNEQVTVAQMKK